MKLKLSVSALLITLVTVELTLRSQGNTEAHTAVHNIELLAITPG